MIVQHLPLCRRKTYFIIDTIYEKSHILLLNEVQI